jgi:penicillin-binding protein 1B
LAAGLLLAAGVVVAVADAWRVSGRFPAAFSRQPSRLYGRILELTPGASCRLADLAAQLARQGYEREPGDEASATVAGAAAAGEGAPRPGTYLLRGETLSVGMRRFPTPAGWDGGRPLAVEVHDGRVARLRLAGLPVAQAAIEPPLLASFYGPAVEEHWPVSLDEIPSQVVQAVLAAEDDGFFQHSGLSARGIARAAWVDLRGRELRQGGSTITQQLVRTLFLSRRRSLLRKTREALLAEIVELRHDKRSILESYLNSISWGHSGPANLVGLGAAARAWFGKPPQELDLAQAAALAAMICAPTEYSPASHPAALVRRRNRVLARLADLGWVDRGEVSRAQAEPLGALPRPLEPRPCAPWFADFAAQEARQRFGVEDLAGGGYLLFASLDAGEQQRAEAAVDAELAILAEGAADAGGPATASADRQQRQASSSSAATADREPAVWTRKDLPRVDGQ